MSSRALSAAACLALLTLIPACGSPRPAEEPENAEPAAASEPPPAPPPPPAPSLYERLGKSEALAGVVEELMGNVLADHRLGKLFDRAHKDKARWKQLTTRMVAELCVVAGGADCGYDGKPMKDAHAGLNVTGPQWDAFIEDLGIALKTRGVDDAVAKALEDKLEQQIRADIVVGKGK